MDESKSAPLTPYGENGFKKATAVIEKDGSLKIVQNKEVGKGSSRFMKGFDGGLSVSLRDVSDSLRLHIGYEHNRIQSILLFYPEIYSKDFLQ